MQSIRHQVFVSSTFTDLRDERAEVIQALWEMDCIPTGMEAFVASNEEQWKVIQRVIDDSDYYVLIIGGRYGSVTKEGMSYTEKEYRYAKEKGIPVLAFVHKNPDDIPAGKSETDNALRAKLDAFRKEVMDAHPIKAWTSASELGGHVSRALIREIKITPRPGWVRNDSSAPAALYERVATLTERIAALTDENTKLKVASSVSTLQAELNDISSLAQGRDTITLSGIRVLEDDDDYEQIEVEWEATVSWDDIISTIGPAAINEVSESEMKKILSKYHAINEMVDGFTFKRSEISLKSWNEVVIQLRALNIIEPGNKKRTVGDRHSYWKITDSGDKYLVSLLAKRRPKLEDVMDQVG